MIISCRRAGAPCHPEGPARDHAPLPPTLSGGNDGHGRRTGAGRAQAAFLTPLLAQHQEHAARLTSRLVNPRPASPAPASSPTATPQAPTLTALQAAEEDAADALVRHLAEVTPSLAQLLASIAASEASHAQLLQSRGGTG